MQTLLIWNLVPEETQLYLIPNVGEWVEQCQNSYINGIAEGEALEALTRVSDALSTRKDYCANADDELATEWAQYRLLDDEIPVLEGKVRVITCGFYL